MTDVLFEILLFSAHLSVALISVVIGVYAISVSYLGKETLRSIRILRRRRNQLGKRVKELAEKIDVGKLEKEIKKYKREEVKLSEKLYLLSLRGAVFLPLIALSLALIFSVAGMLIYPLGQQRYVELCVTFGFAGAAVGIFWLFRVLRAIQWAATRFLAPTFRVFFEGWLDEEKMKTEEKRKLEICISNDGDAIAEDLEVYIFFHPDFKISPRVVDSEVVMQTKGHDHAGLNALITKIRNLHVNIATTLSVDVKAPKKSKRYRIPVAIYERNIGESQHELFLQVVD